MAGRNGRRRAWLRLTRRTRFALPAEHAAFLTRAAGADNVAVFAQYIALLGGVEDDIVECFKKGGGVPYDAFLAFSRDGGGQRAVGAVVTGIPRATPRTRFDRAAGAGSKCSTSAVAGAGS